jgi:hypothetical protein
MTPSLIGKKHRARLSTGSHIACMAKFSALSINREQTPAGSSGPADLLGVECVCVRMSVGMRGRCEQQVRQCCSRMSKKRASERERRRSPTGTRRAHSLARCWNITYGVSQSWEKRQVLLCLTHHTSSFLLAPLMLSLSLLSSPRLRLAFFPAPKQQTWHLCRAAAIASL